MALTVVPVLAYFLVGKVSGAVDEDGEPKNSFWVRLYDPAIRFVLRNRVTRVGTIVAAGALFVASLAIVPLLPTAFIDSGSEKIAQVTVAPPAGASSEQVLERAADVEAILLADPDVELVATSVPGEGDTGFQTVLAASTGRAANSAQIIVRLDPAVDLETKLEAARRSARAGQHGRL